MTTLGVGLGTVAGTARREALENGMVVVVRENSVAPVVALSLLVGVGSRDETTETNGVTALLGRVLLKGTRRRSALDIAHAAEGTGGGIESAADQEYTEVRAQGLARHWRTLLDLVYDVATAPGLEPEEIERERAALVAQIRGLEDQPFHVANRLLARALYGDHPYGLPPSGEAAVVGGLTREDLARHFAAFYTPDRMVLAVSGDVPAGEVLAEAARRFGPAARARAEPPLASPPERPARARLAEARSIQQAHVLLGFLAPPIGHPDYVPLKVMNAVLGGGMSSRLFRTLRDKAGLAYSVGSLYPLRRGSSRLVVHIGTAPANVVAAETGMRRVLEELRAASVPADELGRAKTALAGGFALDLRTNARESFYASLFELAGVGHAYGARYPELVETVEPADVQRVARRYLTESSTVVVAPSQGTPE